MSEPAIGIISIAVLLVLVFLGIHIGFALIVVGFVGVVIIAGLGPASANMATVPFIVTNDFNFAVIPLFILMSAFVARSGIAREAYDTARAWVGHIRGGLAMASVGACGLFAATTGSSMACAVAMGKVAYPEMERNNYASTLASGCIVAGGSLGILIPPSISFVVIGILTELSIGKLFMAGIIPGILEILFYFVTIYIICRINPLLGPAAAKTSFKEKAGSLRLTWPIIVLFLLVIGGIYLGVFTPSEAGGIGAFGALVIGLGRRTISWPGITESLKETVRMTGMLMILLIGAFIFMRFMTVSHLPFALAEMISGLPLGRYAIFAIIVVLYIILGMFTDIIASIVITIPVIYPVILALGFDPIWFGVVIVIVMEMGMITPPIGINVFVLAGMTEIPVGTIFRGVWPFVLAELICIIIITILPQIALFIPSMM